MSADVAQGGAVWRAAVEEACVHGAGLILLGDRPTDATRVRLEAGVLNALMGRLLIAGTVVGAALAGGASGVVDWGLAGSAAMGAATLGVGAVVWPLVGPILEVKALSEMGSPDKIEAAVAVPEDLQGNTKVRLSLPRFGTPSLPTSGSDSSPVFLINEMTFAFLAWRVTDHSAWSCPQMIKLWGEDALIDWPGALGPIITDRDAFMGHVLARLARAESGICPAFVVRPAGSNRVLEYAMPEGSESLASCPAGVGKGRFRQEDVKPKTVVAVVGTAHVGGIVRDWPKTGDLSHIKQLLE